jgi:trk system potassium uptake protein TrkA
MHVIIVGCGRVGASTAAELARAGHDVVVIDRNPDAFRLLPTGFTGRTLVGTGFDREVLESAGIREADALVASASGDNTNAVAARIAKETYRVPDVVARIFDPRRADIYRRYGVQTFAPTSWSVSKIVELIVSPHLEREMAFGNGEVQLLAAWVPVHLVGKPVRDLAIPGEIRVALLVRMGKGIVPVSGTALEKDDQVFVVIHQTAVEKFQRMMGWKS